MSAASEMKVRRRRKDSAEAGWRPQNGFVVWRRPRRPGTVHEVRPSEEKSPCYFPSGV